MSAVVVSGCDSDGGNGDGITVELRTDAFTYEVAPNQQVFLEYENESGFTVYAAFACGRFLEEVNNDAVVQEWPLVEQNCGSNGQPLTQGERWIEDFSSAQLVAVAEGARLDESVRYRFRIRFWRTADTGSEGEDEYSNEFALLQAGDT